MLRHGNESFCPKESLARMHRNFTIISSGASQSRDYSGKRGEYSEFRARRRLDVKGQKERGDERRLKNGYLFRACVQARARVRHRSANVTSGRGGIYIHIYMRSETRRKLFTHLAMSEGEKKFLRIINLEIVYVERDGFGSDFGVGGREGDGKK